MKRIGTMRYTFPGAIADKLRMVDALLVSLALTGVVAVVAPQQLGILAYKGALVAGAIFMGYWSDRRLFKYSRCGEVIGGQDVHAEYRRAIIIAACLLAVGLGA